MNKLIESLNRHRKNGQALLAANFYNAETLQAILFAAKQERSEIILQTSPATLNYLGVKLATAMARAAADEYGVTAWLHLDHATDTDLIHHCIETGYDSVMIDASEFEFTENVQRAKEIVKIAHEKNIAVEAEIGYIPKLGQAGANGTGLTTPEEAQSFIERTNVDLLAIAIGTAHGFYKEKPALDFERLEAISKVVDRPLVLHGGSGLSKDEWRMAIRGGIAKINFATEIKDTFINTIKKSLNGNDEIDLRKVFLPGIRTTARLVAEKIRVCSGN
ncbi:MAG: class II fructose-bisphosphate aldolase [FCB group bacterium]|nr:class II fructose-bisphosphate aldolase [FCB group bacterium]